MKSNNDFNVVLRDFINTLNLPLACELDFLSELDSLVLIRCQAVRLSVFIWTGREM